MSKKRQGRTVGRLGARYGRTVRKRLNQIEVEMRQKHRCPNCNTLRVKRTSVGIWKCGKCNFTFAGAAYLPSSRLNLIARRSIRVT